jgi:hypothetical protein
VETIITKNATTMTKQPKSRRSARMKLSTLFPCG